MGAREDFETVRRAAQFLRSTVRPGVSSSPATCTQRLMEAAGSREVDFIRLYSTPLYAAVIDLAYAALGEERAGGPAGDWRGPSA